MKSSVRNSLILVIAALFIAGCTTTKTAKQPSVTKTPAPVLKKELPAKPSAVVMPEEKIEKAPVQQARASEAVSAEKRVAIEPVKPANITYLQVTNLISEFLDIKAVDNVSGQPRYIGVSENKLVTLEMMGDKENISMASIKLIYPNDIEPVNADLNNAMMLRFLKNISPGIRDWSLSVKDIVARFNALQLGEKKEESIGLGDREVKVITDKNANSITLVAKYQ